MEPSISGAATRKFPLTATTRLLQDHLFPDSSSPLKMEHYNSRGEIIHRTPAYVYLSPYPYPFPLVYPSPPPLPPILQPDERLCARAPDCTTVLPSPYQKDLCKRCLNSIAPPATSESSSSLSSLTPIPSASTPASSRSTPLINTISNINTANHQAPAPIIGKKRTRPGPRSRTQGKTCIPVVSDPYTAVPLAAKRTPRPIPLPPPSTARSSIPSPAISRAATTATAPRPCTTPSCTHSIPAGSSNLTRHCPTCVLADWNARKSGIRKWLEVARRRFAVWGEGESEEEEEGRSRESGRPRSDSNSSSRSSASWSSLSSLSSLTSLDEDDDLDCEKTVSGVVTSTSPALALAPAPAPTHTHTPTPTHTPTTLAPVPTPRPKLTLRFHSTLFQNAKSSRFCCDPTCSRKLEDEYTHVRCVPCRARARQRRRDLFEELTSLRGKRLCETDQDEDQDENAISGARLCAARACTHIIPPRGEYKSNMCLVCRGRGNTVKGGEILTADGRGCTSLDCGMVVTGVGSLCVQCTKRKAWEMHRLERVHQRSCPTTVQPVLHTNRKQTMYPEYDCLSSLAAHFKAQLYAFFRDQAALAIRQKSSHSAPSITATTVIAPSPTSDTPPTSTAADAPTPTPPPLRPLFTFSGQFSTVSSIPTDNFTHPTHGKPTILRDIALVRTELERVSHLSLHLQNPREPVVAFKQGFAMRFACVHSIPLELFVSERGEQVVNEDHLASAMEGIRKDIKGELDVITVTDESHLVVPGQMTVVRFRMGVLDVLI